MTTLHPERALLLGFRRAIAVFAKGIAILNVSPNMPQHAPVIPPVFDGCDIAVSPSVYRLF
jgi:hypothetical protein